MPRVTTPITAYRRTPLTTCTHAAPRASRRSGAACATPRDRVLPAATRATPRRNSRAKRPLVYVMPLVKVTIVRQGPSLRGPSLRPEAVLDLCKRRHVGLLVHVPLLLVARIPLVLLLRRSPSGNLTPRSCPRAARRLDDHADARSLGSASRCHHQGSRREAGQAGTRSHCRSTTLSTCRGRSRTQYRVPTSIYISQLPTQHAAHTTS